MEIGIWKGTLRHGHLEMDIRKWTFGNGHSENENREMEMKRGICKLLTHMEMKTPPCCCFCDSNES